MSIENQPIEIISPEITAERLGGEVINTLDGRTVVLLPQEPDARLTIDDIGLRMSVRGFSTSTSR